MSKVNNASFNMKLADDMSDRVDSMLSDAAKCQYQDLQCETCCDTVGPEEIFHRIQKSLTARKVQHYRTEQLVKMPDVFEKKSE
ncbi:Hypothetical protein NTJ_05415 [Nesidiocoris tenuis]|uniref:Uncharacterized protein n=1 Tax=Nesidiocoris tenuis TaxID=355587 RepID=A0ABN7AK25_9HEMI|nr:Hypothetical protein NTJ_05415 [Nesidiocoris tenuis]